MEDINVSPDGGFQQIYDSINDRVYKKSNPIILVVLVSIVVLYFVFFSYLGESQNNMVVSPELSFLEILMWGLFIFLILINGIQYFYKINVKTALKNFFEGTPEVDIKISANEEGRKGGLINDLDKGLDIIKKEGKMFMKDINGVLQQVQRDLSGNIIPVVAGVKIPQLQIPTFDFMDKNEVFNISDNNYTYEQAKALCKAYDSDLATYSQLENAYEKGGQWCNYGWSSNQMVLYPTQKDTWKNLQKIKGHENDCGRPGINGGYIKNPNAKFGVNCYGIKPTMTKEEEELMKKNKPYPLTKPEIEENKLAEYYKQNLDSIVVSPFNEEKWNRF